MPEISRFYGIVIKMYFDDHNPPHFHADYGSDEAVVDIHNLAIIAGELPPRALVEIYGPMNTRAQITSGGNDFAEDEEELSHDTTKAIGDLELLDDEELWRAARNRLSNDVRSQLEALNFKQQRESRDGREYKSDR